MLFFIIKILTHKPRYALSYVSLLSHDTLSRYQHTRIALVFPMLITICIILHIFVSTESYWTNLLLSADMLIFMSFQLKIFHIWKHAAVYFPLTILKEQHANGIMYCVQSLGLDFFLTIHDGVLNFHKWRGSHLSCL